MKIMQFKDSNEYCEHVELLSPAEALFGFVAWLTTRETPVTFSSTHDAAIAAELVDLFCRVNYLPKPRQDFAKRLNYPES